MANKLPTIFIEQDSNGQLRAFSSGRFYPTRIVFCSNLAPQKLNEEQADARFILKQGKVNGSLTERPILVS
jgi:hypothetical protein